MKTIVYINNIININIILRRREGKNEGREERERKKGEKKGREKRERKREERGEGEVEGRKTCYKREKKGHFCTI